MPYKIIKGYTYSGEEGGASIDSGDGFFGFDIDGEHYILGFGEVQDPSDPTCLPDRVYKMVKYSEKKQTAYCRIERDKRLIARLMAEFHLDMFHM